MGYSIAWLAVETEDHAALFEEAQVELTAEADPNFESPISGAELQGGWFLLVGQGCSHRLIDPGLLASLSRRSACIACSIEEHVMFSSCSYWRDGAEVWSVTHDAQKGIYNLETKGELPATFGPIRERTFREQEADDAGEA